VTVDWRPYKCVPMNVCVGVVCHEDATCTVSANNTAVCVCNDNLIGDGIIDCSPPPIVVITKPKSPPKPICEFDFDCNTLQNSVCVMGSCKCKVGFYLSSGKGKCMSENMCADGYANDCHKNAICSNTEGGYTCTCKPGFHDLTPANKPGTECAQTNECLDPSMNDCDSETQVCLDYPPPRKWRCVERTPAPTPSPTPLPCVNDKAGLTRDTGCTSDKPYCDATEGKRGTCAFCINDNTGELIDTGCDPSGDGRCVAETGKGGNSCAFCVNDKTGNSQDEGCNSGNPDCVADQGKGGDFCASSRFRLYN
jgi:hypothetical protein